MSSKPYVWEAPIHQRESAVKDFSCMFSNFQEVIDQLDAVIPAPSSSMHSDTLIAQVSDLLLPLRFNSMEWQRYVTVGRDCYTRNLVGHCTKFTMLVLVWDKQQESPIHDHARSSCWVKMLHGSLTETRYKFPDAGAADEPLIQMSSTTMAPNSVSYINNNRGIHKMSNTSTTDIAVSLHVYAPMYAKCRIFSPAGGQRVANMLVATAPGGARNPRLLSDETNSCATADACAPAAKRLQPMGEAPSGASSPPSPVDACSPFTSLTAFCRQLAQLGSSAADKERIQTLMEKVALTHTEQEQYVVFDKYRYTRNLVWTNEHYSVLVLGWAPGQDVPAHTHNEHTAYITVLAGSIEFKKYSIPRVAHGQEMKESLRITSTELLTVHSPPLFDDGRTVHSVGNASQSDAAVTLHVYSPPYREIVLHNSEVGAPGANPVVVHPPPKDEDGDVSDTNSDSTTRRTQHVFSLQSPERVFLNLDMLSQVLREILCKPPKGGATNVGALTLRATATAGTPTVGARGAGGGASPPGLSNGATPPSGAGGGITTGGSGGGSTASRPLTPTSASAFSISGAITGSTPAIPPMQSCEKPISAQNMRAVRSLLQSAQLNRQEWMQHVVLSMAHHTHVVLWTCNNFTLVLSCWQPHQRSPPCRYPVSYMWSKTLEGSITYRTLRPTPGTAAATSAAQLAALGQRLSAGQTTPDLMRTPDSLFPSTGVGGGMSLGADQLVSTASLALSSDGTAPISAAAAAAAASGFGLLAGDEADFDVSSEIALPQDAVVFTAPQEIFQWENGPQVSVDVSVSSCIYHISNYYITRLYIRSLHPHRSTYRLHVIAPPDARCLTYRSR